MVSLIFLETFYIKKATFYNKTATVRTNNFDAKKIINVAKNNTYVAKFKQHYVLKKQQNLLF